MGIDLTGATMDEVAKDIDPSYRPNGGFKGTAKPAVKPGTIVPQPHGGALRHGSEPGTNKGGTGRPPSAVRSACREYGYRQVANLGKLVEGLESGELEMTVTEQTRLSEALNKYGVGSTIAYQLDEQETMKLVIGVAAKEYGVDPEALLKSVLEELK